nr:ABC transporter substrate-binding protein [Corynebacterium freneyi]
MPPLAATFVKAPLRRSPRHTGDGKARTAKASTRIRSVIAVLAALPLALTACSPADSLPLDGAGADGTRVIRTSLGNPEGPLYPSDSGSLGQIVLVKQIFAGLTRHAPDGGTVLDDAESIEPNDDFTRWDITIRDGRRFADGSPVTADSYIRAWNDAAYGPNLRLQRNYLEPIVGFDAMDGDEPASELSGLTRTGDLTFTVELTDPMSTFADVLASVAFKPLPDAAFDDPEGFGMRPIGNGPYRLADAPDAWRQGRDINLVPNEEYRGDLVPDNAGLTFVFHRSADAAYADLRSGAIDILPGVPSTVPVAEHFPDTRSSGPGFGMRSLVIPVDQAGFTGEEGRLRRRALSLAIDRPLIVDRLYDGLAVPASGPAPQATRDSGAPIPGAEVLGHDPERARELWREADEIAEWEGPFPIHFPGTGDDRAWIEAVVAQIESTLGIDAIAKPLPTSAAFGELSRSGKYVGAARGSLEPTLPLASQHLLPAFGTDGPLNRSGYSNAEVDALLAEAGRADDPRELHRRISGIILRDLPVIPLWTVDESVAWSAELYGVIVGWDGFPEYAKLR